MQNRQTRIVSLHEYGPVFSTHPSPCVNFQAETLEKGGRKERKEMVRKRVRQKQTKIETMKTNHTS